MAAGEESEATDTRLRRGCLGLRSGGHWQPCGTVASQWLEEPDQETKQELEAEAQA
uniref:Uncharacterized protein n=1 Tax=Thermogemmatispora argillosa TaxID=2045280 RepID=A0A455SYU5_9CHLR|nr:hypothetical protein KTA_09650 [Thermogemmatispora argillosa]